MKYNDPLNILFGNDIATLIYSYSDPWKLIYRNNMKEIKKIRHRNRNNTINTNINGKEHSMVIKQWKHKLFIDLLKGRKIIKWNLKENYLFRYCRRHELYYIDECKDCVEEYRLISIEEEERRVQEEILRKKEKIEFNLINDHCKKKYGNDTMYFINYYGYLKGFCVVFSDGRKIKVTPADQPIKQEHETRISLKII
jgi:hypothetical protein